jgi:hypothetical protein
LSERDGLRALLNCGELYKMTLGTRMRGAEPRLAIANGELEQRSSPDRGWRNLWTREGMMGWLNTQSHR